MRRLSIVLLAAGLWCGNALGQTVVKYVHTDALGSVVALTDAAGGLVEASTREYEPYGQQLAPAVADGPGYTGHVQDAASGLTYMQQRYYDPQVGRFLSVDPATALSNPAGYFGRYHYANGNPYKFTDPDGRVWGVAAKIVKVVVKGGDVASTVAGAVADGKVIVSRDATLGQRLVAAGSLVTELASPVSARDIKAGIGALKEIPVSRAKYGDAADHIADAQKAGKPDVLTIARRGAAGNRTNATGGLPKVAGHQLDEYPPAMFAEGGVGASVRPVNPRNNMAAGACIGNACRGLADGEKVRIKVVE